jgi:hypothetical protein
MTSIGNALPGWFRRGKSNEDSHASGNDGPSSTQGKPGTDPGVEAGAQPKTDPLFPTEPGGISVPVTGGAGETEPVVVWEAANRMEAEIVRGRLESEGIPAVITGDVAGSIFGLNVGNLAKSSVLVPAPLADRAKRILESTVDDEGELEDEDGMAGAGISGSDKDAVDEANSARDEPDDAR